MYFSDFSPQQQLFSKSYIPSSLPLPSMMNMFQNPFAINNNNNNNGRQAMGMMKRQYQSFPFNYAPPFGLFNSKFTFCNLSEHFHIVGSC